LAESHVASRRYPANTTTFNAEHAEPAEISLGVLSVVSAISALNLRHVVVVEAAVPLVRET